MAISDCADKFMGVNTRKSLCESIYMDDIMLPSYSFKDKIANMVDEVDTGLNKANFNVKEWVLTGEKKKKIKFLSYIYYSETDTFSVRPKINLSPRKRGVRKAEDVKDMDQLKDHIKEFPLTKRTLASILMGSLHDPLHIMVHMSTI